MIFGCEIRPDRVQKSVSGVIWGLFEGDLEVFGGGLGQPKGSTDRPKGPHLIWCRKSLGRASRSLESQDCGQMHSCVISPKFAEVCTTLTYNISEMLNMMAISQNRRNQGFVSDSEYLRRRGLRYQISVLQHAKDQR